MVATIDRSKLAVEDAAVPFLDERAAAAAEAVADWLRSHAAEYGVELQRVVLRFCRSYEDPRYYDLVIDFHVSGTAARAMAFQDRAAEVLGRLVMRAPSQAAERLSVEVHWL